MTSVRMPTNGNVLVATSPGRGTLPSNFSSRRFAVSAASPYSTVTMLGFASAADSPNAARRQATIGRKVRALFANVHKLKSLSADSDGAWREAAGRERAPVAPTLCPHDGNVRSSRHSLPPRRLSRTPGGACVLYACDEIDVNDKTKFRAQWTNEERSHCRKVALFSTRPCTPSQKFSTELARRSPRK